MRRVLAQLLSIGALSGCSLIYNPSNLPEPRADAAKPVDAAVDAPLADANPALLMLTEVTSPPLLEGEGDGGSAPALLVVYGMNITKQATIAVAPTTANADVSLELGASSIADDGNSIAVLVTAHVMPTVGEGAAIPLTVTVEQPGATPQTIAWSLQPLDELTTAGSQAVPPANKLYARVAVSNLAFTSGSARAIVRAVADIEITGTVSANASGSTAGAGGCAGGAAGENGACFGGGKAQGGGGGFGTAGDNGGNGTAGAASGDELVRSYDATGSAENRGGGGGGGNGAAGGGGGGSIELTAGGNVTVRGVEAKGAAGANAGVGRGAGGGAGGLVLLRAGGTLTYPMTLAATGGAGGRGGLLGEEGGGGGDGRARVDAAALVGTAPATPTPRRGPMLVRPANPIFEITQPTLMIAGAPGDRVDVIVVYPDGSSQTISQHLLTGPLTPVQPTLAIGLNKVCVLVPGGTFGRDEAQNCIAAAFVP